MTVDALDKHGYESERDRHRDNAERALMAAHGAAEFLLAELRGGPHAVCSPRDLVTHGAKAYAELEAYEALRQVSFLTEDRNENSEEQK